MGLLARIRNGSAAQPPADEAPLVARRAPAPPLPEWRRRAAEKVEEVGFVAVTDLTRQLS